jgi:hypothetical protein
MAAVIAAGLHGVEKGLKLTAPPITGTNQGAENIPRAPRTLIETTRIFREIGHRARLAGRHLRRPLRRHPRVGMAPVAGRGDRLGIETLLRDHLMAPADPPARRADAAVYRELRLRGLREHPTPSPPATRKKTRAGWPTPKSAGPPRTSSGAPSRTANWPA